VVDFIDFILQILDLFTQVYGVVQFGGDGLVHFVLHQFFSEVDDGLGQLIDFGRLLRQFGLEFDDQFVLLNLDLPQFL